ncbi:M48 family metallopeptidase [Thalassotalea ganghwensis]
MSYSEIKGVYHTPASSISQQVVLDVIGESVLIKDAISKTLLLTLPLSTIKLSPAIGSIPREFSLEDGAKVVILADENLERLSRNQSKTNNLLHAIEQHRTLWLVSLLLIPICIYMLTAHLIPAAAHSVVKWLPEPVKYQIDNQSMSILEKSLLTQSHLSLDTKAKVSHQWNELVSIVRTNHQQYKLLFRNSHTLGANAFALPGGTVVITDQFVNLLKDSPDAIVAVLLHEIGHVEHNHGLQLMTESIATSLMLTYFLGDLNDLAEVVSGTALTLIQNSFSRDLERQADSYARDKLIELGKSPAALAIALKRISEDSEVQDHLINEYLSSHPLLEERLKNALYVKPEEAH